MYSQMAQAYTGERGPVLPIGLVSNRIREKMDEKQKLEAVYGEDYVDVTDDVQCYERGKTFKCECGQDFGTDFERFAIKCPTCSRHCVDTDTDSRGPPKREKGQAGLGEWT